MAILILQIVSELTGDWLTTSAKSVGTFVVYELTLAALALLICIEFANHGLWRLRAPGEMLRDMRMVRGRAKLDEAIRAAEAGLIASKELFRTDREQARKNTSVVLNVVYAAARRALNVSRRESLNRLALSVGCLIALLTMSALLATAYYGDSVAFAHLSLDGGVLRHFYYVVSTLMTIGYGDISAGNVFGYFFVAACAVLAIFMLTLGISFIVSHWYYCVSRLDQDLRSELLDIVRRLAIPLVLIRLWL